MLSEQKYAQNSRNQFSNKISRHSEKLTYQKIHDDLHNFHLTYQPPQRKLPNIVGNFPFHTKDKSYIGLSCSRHTPSEWTTLGKVKVLFGMSRVWELSSPKISRNFSEYPQGTGRNDRVFIEPYSRPILSGILNICQCFFLGHYTASATVLHFDWDGSQQNLYTSKPYTGAVNI